MWIKRKDSDAINLDCVKCIEKIIKKESNDYSATYKIKFYFNDTSYNTSYQFYNAQDCNEYYEALMNHIEARELPLFKL